MNSPGNETDTLVVGLAQIAPVWLDRKMTLQKILDFVSDAAKRKCDIVAFGEAILPGYPFWIERTDGARFNSPVQKELFARYAREAISLEEGHIDPIRVLAAQKKITVILGTVERPLERGGHSLYCSLVRIDETGAIRNVHRKLVPTYEERLVWAPGDGHGLRVFPAGAFTVGALNCWENWIPSARAALYALGEDLHFALWPGSVRNTEDITRFIAREARSFVVSVSGLMRREDIRDDIPHADLTRRNSDAFLADGGSCLAAPDGSWVVEPFVGEERLMTAEMDWKRVAEERQNFDPAGHYSRPDIFRFHVNRERQRAATFTEKDFDASSPDT